jgi:serine protease Do
MRMPTNPMPRWFTLSALGACFLVLPVFGASSARKTPIVVAIERARAAVVDIRSEKRSPLNTFGDRSVNGMGTGIILDERGYIVTNQHVVEGVASLHVTTQDGSIYPAHVVSADAQTDLAIIKINPKSPLPVIPMGSSADLMVGEQVIAVGNAYGYEHTVTVGIISALGRHVEVSDSQAYENLIQTDASINPGNSGGPLMNIDGDLIGINVAIRSGAQGIGFAIPIDDARRVIADLMSVRRLRHVSHGIIGRETDLGAEPSGVLIERFEKEAVAEDDGLKPGDVIVAAGDRTIANRVDLERALLDQNPGDSVEFQVNRAGKPTKVQVTLRPAPASDDSADKAWQSLGLRLLPVAAHEVQRYDAKYRGGLRVIVVRPDSPAERRGIREGDVLVGLHVWETVTPANVSYVLARPDISQFYPLKFYVLRGGQTLFGYLDIASERVSE